MVLSKRKLITQLKFYFSLVDKLLRLKLERKHYFIFLKNLSLPSETIESLAQRGFRLKVSSDLTEALAILEQSKPQHVIAFLNNDKNCAEVIATRFSEPLMFNHSKLFLVSDQALTKVKGLHFSSLGYTDYFVMKSLSSFFGELELINFPLAS